MFYSPNIAVENVNKKEIRDVRSVVLEIREVSSSIGGLLEDAPITDPVHTSVSKAVWKSEALEAMKIDPVIMKESELNGARNLLSEQFVEEESQEDGDDQDEEDRKSLKELQETRAQMSLLKQGKEVLAMQSKCELNISKKLQGKMIGRVVVVNEVSVFMLQHTQYI